MASKGKTLIAVALRPEAKPFIESFGLKQVDRAGGFTTYTSDDIVLVISGVGRSRMAAAVGMCFGAWGEAIDLAFNVGVAGCLNGRFDVGSLVWVNKLLEPASHLEYYPDMLAESNLPEGSLATSDHIVSLTGSTKVSSSDLVDMEGSAFFATASMWLPPHRIQCLKVVSDVGDGNLPKAQQVTKLMSASTSAILSTISSVRGLPVVEQDPLDGAALECYSTLCHHLRLTATQQVQLGDSFKRYLLLSNNALPDFSNLLDEPVATKGDGKRLLKTVQQLLTP